MKKVAWETVFVGWLMTFLSRNVQNQVYNLQNNKTKKNVCIHVFQWSKWNRREFQRIASVLKTMMWGIVARASRLPSTTAPAPVTCLSLAPVELDNECSKWWLCCVSMFKVMMAFIDGMWVHFINDRLAISLLRLSFDEKCQELIFGVFICFWCCRVWSEVLIKVCEQVWDLVKRHLGLV